MIQIRGLTKRYGDFEALKGIDLDVAPGEFLVVLGPSGAGKSTLLRCINRLTEPTQGEVRVDGQLVRADAASLRALRCQVAMIFQHYNVVPRLSVLKNVLTGRMGSMPSVASWLQVFPRKDIEIAHECLRRVALDDKALLRTDTLSGGQKQRVGIARALAMEPKVLLMDEPFGALDALTRARLQDELLKIVARTKSTTVMVTHDVDEAVLLSDRIVMMTNGPAATIGEVLAVNLPRPRDRVELAEDRDYVHHRKAVLDFLYTRQGHVEQAAA